jgi:hypothetical protein
MYLMVYTSDVLHDAHVHDVLDDAHNVVRDVVHE